MKGLGSHTLLIPKGKPPLSFAILDALPCCTYLSRTTTLSQLRCRQKLRLSLARGTIRAQASNVSVGPGDYGSNSEKDSQNVSETNSVDDSSSKIAKPIQIPYPVSIAFVLFGCTLVFSLIAFVKGGPSSVLAAIAKSGFTAAFTLIFVSEIGDKLSPSLVYELDRTRSFLFTVPLMSSKYPFGDIHTPYPHLVVP
ncbi:gdt1-like protein chloroplastic-like [Trifolium pratense]|uniref:Gdt1-like protein chloroplastic-like n=1 Tax=Trifolium pratense TaxID=57577 RepID=A0A2K3P8E6_TRIPR|nr:gdt1-like protein chloroplastic-like [Trifolium pratense]